MSCDLVVEMLLILKKNIFNLIFRGQVLNMTVQKMSHNLWRKPVSATGAKQLLKVPLLPSNHTIIHPDAHVTNSASSALRI